LFLLPIISTTEATSPKITAIGAEKEPPINEQSSVSSENLKQSTIISEVPKLNESPQRPSENSISPVIKIFNDPYSTNLKVLKSEQEIAGSYRLLHLTVKNIGNETIRFSSNIFITFVTKDISGETINNYTQKIGQNILELPIQPKEIASSTAFLFRTDEAAVYEITIEKR